MRTSLVGLIIALGLLGPVLCLSGELVHACDDSANEQGCGHEEDCPEDPCGETAVRPRESGSSGSVGIDAPFLLPVLPPSPLFARSCEAGLRPARIDVSPRARSAIPIPLRI